MKYKKILIILIIMMSIPILSFAEGEMIVFPVDRADILNSMDLSGYTIGISEDGKNYILTPNPKKELPPIIEEPEIIEIPEPTPNPMPVPTPNPIPAPAPTNDNNTKDEDYIGIIPPNTKDSNDNYDVYETPVYDFSDFEFYYNPYADTDFSFYENLNPNDYYGIINEEKEHVPGEKFLKTGQTIQYLFKSEQKYPMYKDTGIKPNDGILDFDIIRSLVRQLAVGKKTKVIEDINKSMILVDGKLIIIGEEETDVEKFIKKFDKTSIKILLQDTRAGGKFNVVDYMEVMKELKIRIDEGEVILITDPIIDNSRALIPIRSIAVGLGAEVRWDNENKEAIITKNEKRIIFKENSDVVKVNDKSYLITHKTHVKEDEMRMLSVIRLLVVELGGTMEWDSKELELIISTVKE